VRFCFSHTDLTEELRKQLQDLGISENILVHKPGDQTVDALGWEKLLAMLRTMGVEPQPLKKVTRTRPFLERFVTIKYQGKRGQTNS
jgi:hypothetical protein